MSNLTSDVAEFHEKFKRKYDGPPRYLPELQERFRLKAMREELQEYEDADTLEKKLDALVDLVYFVIGAADDHGFDFCEAWRRVHAANMTKELSHPNNPSKRGPEFNGIDIVKPPGWVAPDLEDLVKEVL